MNQNKTNTITCVKMTKHDFTQAILNTKTTNMSVSGSQTEKSITKNILKNALKKPIKDYYVDAKTKDVLIELDLNANTPFSIEQIKELCDENGYITGYIAISVYDVIDVSFDTFIDILSLKLTNTTLLSDISYTLIGCDSNENLIFEVSGCTELIIENNE